MFPRLHRLVVTAALAVAALAPQSVAAEFPPYTRVVTIAVVGPMSGPQQQFGLDLAAGVQQAIDEVNQRRSITDFGWAMRSYDDQADAGIAQQEAQFALVEPTTAAVIGHVGGQETLLALPVYHDVAIPLIVPTSPLAALTRAGYDNVFRLCPSDIEEGRMDARYAERVLKAKRVAVVYEEEDYGVDGARGFVEYARSGKAMDAKDISVDVELANLGKAVDAVKGYGPDLIFVAGLARDAPRIVARLRASGVDTPILGTQALFGDQAAKTLARVSGLTASACVPPLQLIPSAQLFVNRYQSAHGRVSSYALFGYVAAQVAISAIQASRNLDHRAVDRQLATGAFPTVLGPVSFTRTGDIASPNAYLYILTGGKFTYAGSVYPSPLVGR